MKANLNNGNTFLDTKEFRLLFNLLEKSEQILSIIDLSDSSISKYNTLKKITFEMLNLEFKPLEKKYIPAPSQNNQNNINTNNNNQNINDEYFYLLYFQYLRKSMLIELMVNFLTNINNINEEETINNYLNSLVEIYNLSTDVISSKASNDIQLEVKSEESKFPSLFNKIDKIFKENFKNIKQMKANYENELLQIKENYNKDLLDLKNNLGKNKKINKENNINKTKNNNNENNFYLEKISTLIDESYEQFKQYFPNLNSTKSIAYKDGKCDENILKLEFVKNAFDEYFNIKKNPNVINSNNEINKRLYVGNNFSNNDLLRDICSDLPEIQKENDIFHKNFNDLMNYISSNIEGKVI